MKLTTLHKFTNSKNLRKKFHLEFFSPVEALKDEEPRNLQTLILHPKPF